MPTSREDDIRIIEANIERTKAAVANSMNDTVLMTSLLKELRDLHARLAALTSRRP